MRTAYSQTRREAAPPTPPPPPPPPPSQTRLRRREAAPPPPPPPDLGCHGGVPRSRRSPPDPVRTEYALTRLRPRDHRFPADIEYSILLRLPVKPLCRFKCACKSWSSLISSPGFQRDHSRRSQSNPKLFLFRPGDYGTLDFHTFHIEGTPINKFSKTFPDDYTMANTVPVQSCLGLVCISPQYNGRPALICNPSTEEFIALPATGLGLPEFTLCMGFAYAAATNQFRVVKFFSDAISGDKKERCMVFTLGSSEWREAKNPAPYRVCEGAAPYLNGALHLLPLDYGDGKPENRYIAAFDVEREECKRVPFPEYWHTIVEDHLFQPGLDEVRLNVLGGSLCLSIFFGENKGKMELWFLKDYNNVEWVKGYHMDFSTVTYPFIFYNWAHRVGIMVDETVLPNILRSGKSEYLPYFPNDEEFAKSFTPDCSGALYVESLFSPKKSFAAC